MDEHLETALAPPGALPAIALGIIAWNEEEAIGPMLASLFAQSIWPRLVERGLTAQIVCVTNGCTDATPALVTEIFAAQSREHPWRRAFRCQPVDLSERGKLNAWNVFVHQLSAPSARYLFLLDGDIILRHPDTLWNLFRALENDPRAGVATDQPLKDIAFKARPSLLEHLSLAASRAAQSASAQLTGQLYCIRAEIARNIYLPRGLAACEDGFIKSLVCTSFLTEPSDPRRILEAPDASHVFQAYLSPAQILNNQKRQMIGQTCVHLLIDRELRSLAMEQKRRLASLLREREAVDAVWLQRRMAEHLCQTRYFWRLFPGIPTFHFRRLAGLRGWERIRRVPVSLLGWLIMQSACWRAWRALRRGCTEYWPDTHSPNLRRFPSTCSVTKNRLAGAAAPGQGVDS